MMASNSTRVQVKFEDVAVGDELPVLHKGPLTPVHLVRWSAAMENWHRIHYDERFAVEHDKLPGLLVNGSFKQQFIMQFLKDWAGLEGWAWKARFRFRAMDVAGATLEIWACVAAKIPCDEYGLIELDLGIRNPARADTTTGSALVALPFSRGGRVPYPFVPPAADPWARIALHSS